MIEERLRQILADALEPLVARLTAVEQQLQGTELVAGELRTAEPGQSLPPAQYASGGFISGPGSRAVEPEPLPEEADPEPPKPARKRAPRKPSAPDA
jgi:hypothetical protein